MKVFQKITSLFLAAIFLLSSLGFTVNKMVCLKSGKVKLSLVHEKECCPAKESNTPVIKSKCCDILNTDFNLDDFQGAQKLDISQPFVAALPFAYSALNVSSPLASQKLVYSFADLPPPLYGRQLLSFISVLVI